MQDKADGFSFKQCFKQAQSHKQLDLESSTATDNVALRQINVELVEKVAHKNRIYDSVQCIISQNTTNFIC